MPTPINPDTHCTTCGEPLSEYGHCWQHNYPLTAADDPREAAPYCDGKCGICSCISSPQTPAPTNANETTAYPLSWPLGRPRTTLRKKSLFTTSLASARDGLMEELELMGADNPILSTNLTLRRDGLPLASQRQPADVGVAVYFTWRNVPYALGCDCWDRVEANVQAVRKTVEALRGIARWGTGEMMAAAFVGFKALNPANAKPPQTWWQLLGVEHNDGPDTINAAYKQLAKTAHPDAGGSHERMTQLNEARALGLKQNPF